MPEKQRKARREECAGKAKNDKTNINDDGLKSRIQG